MLDTPLRKVAQQVLAKFGTSVVVRQVAGNYIVSTGTVTQTTVDVTVKARLSDYTNRELGQLIQAGDRKVEIAAADLSFVPTVDDELLIAGVSHDIIRVQQELATDLPALYILQVRR